ncbi:hypothetical protein Goshw_021096 [Gossypium schwendimanii]|uniref:RNase H type-1 domain-containing protein n=1 Tax=Gossypium schwendimanii TaxID=34291 RepID=A0A7J9MUK0_GOSSC|nr:hypothetical protein [Gossypium schwendimanii]
MWSVRGGELAIVALAPSVVMKLRISYMCFAIAQQQRKFGRLLSLLIKGTGFSQCEISHMRFQQNDHISDPPASLMDSRVHLFTDGAVTRDSEKASVGGVLRDQFGNWILGFNRFLGSCTPFEAKLWGILDGITVLRRVQGLLESEGQWWIRYVPREANTVANCLANMSLEWKTSLQIYEDPFDEVSEMLQQDKVSETFAQEHLI